MQHLYKNFLSDASVYAQSRMLWENAAISLLGEDLYFPFYHDSFLNTKPFLDGNPIFSAQNKKNGRVIRIIQEEAESTNPQIAFWHKNIETENGDADELIIALELSDITEIITYALMKAWLYNEKEVSETIAFGNELKKKAECLSFEKSAYQDFINDLKKEIS